MFDLGIKRMSVSFAAFCMLIVGGNIIGRTNEVTPH